MIIKGDKIKLVQKIGNFDKVGDIFEVSGVDNGVISFKCNYGTGCMSYDEFEKYFEKIEKRKWTEWTLQPLYFYDPFKYKKYYEAIIRVRHNGKKIQVQCGNCKAEATCHSGDTFIYSKGYELAKRRLIVKMIKGKVESYAKKM